jgi:YVTN family beta-propeller protein
MLRSCCWGTTNRPTFRYSNIRRAVLFVTTPINSNPIAQYMFMPFSAVAAGLAISSDGTTLYVANYQNDSLSIVNTATRTVSNEIVFFAPGQLRQLVKCPTGRLRCRMRKALRLRLMSAASGMAKCCRERFRSGEAHQGWRRAKSHDVVRRSASALCCQRRS